MKKIIILLLFAGLCGTGLAQKQTLAEIKKELETTPDPVGYVKYKLKKQYFIDSVSVVSTMTFMGKADSLAYKGKVGKVYGPFKRENILVKILAKAPNTFYHVKHILIDTAVYRPAFAESLADSIILRIRSGTSTFAEQASIYSGDFISSPMGGDLGWFVRGVMLKQMDRELPKRKKGEIFKVWTAAGLHVILIADNPKEDTGYALLLRVIL